MYLWRRSVSQKWFRDNETQLRILAGVDLAVIEQTNRKRLQLEIAAKSRAELRTLANEFGGRIEKLSPDWQRRFLSRKTKPLKVGNRRLVIPAGPAFGTGEHATTGMALRLLEHLTRNWKPQLSIVDLGTGSGILALAAKCLGATRVLGIDNDPVAISTAKQNARLNKIRGVTFRIEDVRRWKVPAKTNVVTANLFSELLIAILPKLKAAPWLILSGILRDQERDITQALRRNRIDVVDTRRRGKWVAILAAVR
jgi:ribosomal protein L11 methyltransferase